MFERFNLVHFEANALMQSEYRTYMDGASDHKRTAARQETAHNNRSRITGSFDYLLPRISAEGSAEPEAAELYLQSFCVFRNSAGYFTSRSDYESLLLSYTFDGEGTLRYGEQSYALRQGTGFVIDCRQPHEYKISADCWEHVDIHIWGLQAERFCRYFQQMKLTAFSFSAALFQALTEELLEEYTGNTKLRSLYISNSLSNLLYAILADAEKKNAFQLPPVYRNIIPYLEKNYLKPLSLDELTEQFHVSKYHMCREFKRYTGSTLIEYLITLRVNHAFYLLIQTDLPVEEICEKSGFRNRSNFIAQIKKRTGMTPSELRKSYR